MNKTVIDDRGNKTLIFRLRVSKLKPFVVRSSPILRTTEVSMKGGILEIKQLMLLK